MSDTVTRHETARTWGPYIFAIVTILLAVIGAAWLNGNMGGKIDSVSDVVHKVSEAVSKNGRAIAASNTEIGRLGGLLEAYQVRPRIAPSRPNEQLERLNEQIEQLERLNEQLKTALAALTPAEQTLTQERPSSR